MPEIQMARRAEGYVGINGVNIWGDIREYVTNITYTDVASGENDTFDISLIDSDAHFLNDWLIDKGTLINAQFKLSDWKYAGDTYFMDCGEFICDALKINGPPCEVTIQSLALPKNGTKNSKKWENYKISGIAREISSKCGCSLEYYADDITIESTQQSRQTDIEFLFKLCSEYGFGMKVYRHSIVIFDRERKDNEEAVGEAIDISSTDNYDLSDNEEGTYTGVKFIYKPKGSDNDQTYTRGSGERLLIVNGSAKTAKEAELKAKAALYNENCERVKVKFSIMGGEPIYAGTNRMITGIGSYSGKYSIDRVTHTLSGSSVYKQKIEAHAIDILC